MQIKSFRLRIRVVIFFIVLFAILLTSRLFLVQIVNSNNYSERADRQYVTPSSNIFNRGSIFLSKRDGSLVAGATISSGFKIAIVPKNIKDIDNTYNMLEPYLEMDKETFLRKASKKDDPYEEVAVKLNKEQATAIEEMKLDGVNIHKDSWRFYPGNNLAAHLLGFLAYKGDDRVGQYGLERHFEETLSRPKDEVFVNFFAEVFSNISSGVSETNKGDIITYIEPLVQHTLEAELRDAMKKWNAEQAGGIIIDPMTGEIYAMVNLPDFDLNDFRRVSDIDVYRNPLVESVYEFGSVIKPLVVASALDVGVINGETKYNDEGYVVVDKKTINNFDKKGRGMVNIQDILSQSLNTGMVFIESKIGHDNFRKYMKSFGLGDKTNIDLPNEVKGLISNLDATRNLEYANASFGQGIAISPIEAVISFSALANGGNIIVPRVVKEIKYDNGLSKKTKVEYNRENVIKKETADTITQMLIKVFESYGQGKYKLEHYSIASKTGTAQIADEKQRGYYADRHMHSFFGYYPAYEPRFLTFIFIKNPKGVRYASETLIPPFLNITKFMLNYYNIPPDR
jgi:stage V sporulation protein D (sporulation-specific penicillin-binding protein)